MLPIRTFQNLNIKKTKHLAAKKHYKGVNNKKNILMLKKLLYITSLIFL